MYMARTMYLLPQPDTTPNLTVSYRFVLVHVADDLT